MKTLILSHILTFSVPKTSIILVYCNPKSQRMNLASLSVLVTSLGISKPCMNLSHVGRDHHIRLLFRYLLTMRPRLELQGRKAVSGKDKPWTALVYTVRALSWLFRARVFSFCFVINDERMHGFAPCVCIFVSDSSLTIPLPSAFALF